MNIKGYDTWKLQGPEDSDEIGNEEGEMCNRYPEPDEDMPRGYRLKPCSGEMVFSDGVLICNKCAEMGE